jgi:hypothetical protein
MDVDYFDLAWNGITRDKLEKMFANCARGGIEAMVWSVVTCGLAEYHSKIMPLYDGRDRRIGSKRCEEGLRSFDSLAAGVEFGKKYGIRILPYFRMFDDYWPGMIDETIDRIPHGWWESRCGWFQLKGWPCYNDPAVREYKLRLVKEIADYGVDGFMFGCTRSHSLYVMPYRQAHFFGYNPVIADEYKRRYGADIRKFDYAVEKGCSEGPFAHKDITFINGFEYVGAETFDLKKWQDLKGEGVTEFLREARKITGPGAHILMEASHWACPPVADPNDDYPAKMFFYPADLAKEGIINEWVVSMNWRGVNFGFEETLLTTFQFVQDAGAPINVWLNDLFSPTGGETTKWATPDQFREYLEKFKTSQMTACTIHEADFLIQNPQAEEMWKVLKELFGK